MGLLAVLANIQARHHRGRAFSLIQNWPAVRLFASAKRPLSSPYRSPFQLCRQPRKSEGKMLDIYWRQRRSSARRHIFTIHQNANVTLARYLITLRGSRPPKASDLKFLYIRNLIEKLFYHTKLMPSYFCISSDKKTKCNAYHFFPSEATQNPVILYLYRVFRLIWTSYPAFCMQYIYERLDIRGIARLKRTNDLPTPFVWCKFQPITSVNEVGEGLKIWLSDRPLDFHRPVWLEILDLDLMLLSLNFLSI